MAKCTTNKIYEFCWYLFVCAKSKYPENSVDLVTAFHMLLCCVDLIFANAIADKRDDLVNLKFPGIPEHWLRKDDTSLDKKKPLCIMSLLCSRHDGSFIDASSTKEYAWRSVIKDYIANNILKCDRDFMGLIQPENFYTNLNGLKKLYESYVLSIGDIDEGILLAQTDISENSSKFINSI